MGNLVQTGYMQRNEYKDIGEDDQVIYTFYFVVVLKLTCLLHSYF